MLISKTDSKLVLTVSINLLFKIMSSSAKAFNALGDPTRRVIFEKLRAHPLAVVDIARGLAVSRPAVSQHLKVLREAKLISIHQQGTKNIYQIDQQGILAMRKYLDNFWDTGLAAFKLTAEKKEEDE
ncbi:MAG TPA: metalloregulator ArsR/SmtB family transcription factor [Puia sp.]|nr:metalloregulator ArsR/SmtB family transcription factor [Puia sp.]